MKVTIGVIALNEENNIKTILQNIVDQDYPLKNIEIILVDSGSTDSTKQIMLDFAKEQKGFWNIGVYDNEKKVQPSGWNVVVAHAKGDVIIRLDAHSLIPSDFVKNNIECIESGEFVCGGRRINIINDDSKNKRVLLMAENSMFGSGIADYRRNSEKKYVKTVAHACYKKEVFEKVGLFDERLIRSEDNDMHYRIREQGYNICMSGNIISEYQTRPTLKGMIKQKYGNGKWIGITSLIKTPKMFSIYHFIPFLFVLGVIAATAMLVPAIIFWSKCWWLCLPFAVGVGSYLLIELMLSVKSCVDYKNPIGIILLPFIFPMLHFAYGIGTLVGFLCARNYRGERL